MKVIRYLLTEARKALAAGATGAGALIEAGLLHGTALIVAVALTAVVGTTAVHQIPNVTSGSQ